MKVWVLIKARFVGTEPKNYSLKTYQDFWVKVKIPAAPIIGLRLTNIPGVPWISMEPVEKVFYSFQRDGYSCHLKTLAIENINDFTIFTNAMRETFGTNLPKELL